MSVKKNLYRDKSLGHELYDASQKPNVGDKEAARRQGKGANAFAGSDVVHLQSKLEGLPAISRQQDQLAIRKRQPNPRVGMGSHVASEAPEMGLVGGGREKAEAEKAKIFRHRTASKWPYKSEGGSASNLERVPRKEVGHDRNWNSKEEE